MVRSGELINSLSVLLARSISRAFTTLHGFLPRQRTHSPEETTYRLPVPKSRPSTIFVMGLPGVGKKAGKVVADSVEKAEKLAQTKQESAKVQQAQEILAQKYDESLFEGFKQKRKELRRKINMQRSGRWIMRTTIVGGAIVATVLTLGPGASAFALEPAYEKAVRGQRKAEKQAKADLKAEFVKRSQDGSRLKQTNPDWLFDKGVNSMQDLDSYSLRSGSSDVDILKVARHGEVVGFAASEGSEAPLGVADLAMSETSESSESDAESWGSDVEKK